MTAAPTHQADDDGELIGRCYTKARRTPLVVGSVPGGAGRSLRLPGGPYTLTQLAAMVLVVVLLVLSRPLWGGHGLLDAVVLVTLPFVAAFGLRHLHVDGRNPAAAAASVLLMLTGPRHGQLRGRAVRRHRPAVTSAVLTVGGAQTSAQVADEPGRHSTARPRPAAARPAERATGPVTTAPGRPVASGVQALLNRRTSVGE
ncbi:hypothetical protein [Streptomyces melanogenes]|uniref:hypothetical protein n=1 Tax=Streptomyces melanogenes TaxID=67326 RepID=UPI0037A3CAC0